MSLRTPSIVGSLFVALACLAASPVRAAADLDPAFGSAGAAKLADPVVPPDQVVALPDGALIAVDPPRFEGRSLRLRLRQLTPAGLPDAGWGTTGEVEHLLGPFLQDPFDRAVATPAGVASDGRLLVMLALSVTPTALTPGRGFSYRFAVMLRRDGTLDRTFGNSGVFAPAEYGRFEEFPNLSPEGTVHTRVYDMLGDVYPIFTGVRRYDLAGRLDSGFDYRGPDDYDSSGVLVVLPRPTHRDYLVVTQDAVYRLGADGAPDPGLGPAGKLRLEEPLLAALVAPQGRAFGTGFRIRAATLAPGGRLVVAADWERLSGVEPSPLAWPWVLARFDAAGELDRGFGAAASGVVRFAAGSISLADLSVTPTDSALTLTTNAIGEILGVVGARNARSADPREIATYGGWLLRVTADGRVVEGIGDRTTRWYSIGAFSLVSAASGRQPLLALPGGLVVRLADTATDAAGLFSVADSISSLDESQGTAAVPVMRIGGRRGRVSLRYRLDAVTDGSAAATPGLDFVAETGRLEWEDGDTATKYIPVTLLDDTLDENYESLQVVFDDPQGGARLTATQVRAGIQSSDRPVTPSTVAAPSSSRSAPSAAGGGGGVDIALLATLGLALLAAGGRFAGTARQRITADLRRFAGACRARPAAWVAAATFRSHRKRVAHHQLAIDALPRIEVLRMEHAAAGQQRGRDDRRVVEREAMVLRRLAGQVVGLY